MAANVSASGAYDDVSAATDSTASTAYTRTPDARAATATSAGVASTSTAASVAGSTPPSPPAATTDDIFVASETSSDARPVHVTATDPSSATETSGVSPATSSAPNARGGAMGVGANAAATTAPPSGCASIRDANADGSRSAPTIRITPSDPSPHPTTRCVPSGAATATRAAGARGGEIGIGVRLDDFRRRRRVPRARRAVRRHRR